MLRFVVQFQVVLQREVFVLFLVEFSHNAHVFVLKVIVGADTLFELLRDQSRIERALSELLESFYSFQLFFLSMVSPLKASMFHRLVTQSFWR